MAGFVGFEAANKHVQKGSLEPVPAVPTPVEVVAAVRCGDYYFWTGQGRLDVANLSLKLLAFPFVPLPGLPAQDCDVIKRCLGLD